ncbi:hypothetical protein [Bacillus sp. FSL K6-6540]|uniref:hypothetical protein n=1 Tax=Bacillus sp. FSL K6-6540 TaxID=2921512 RepID=UPI0030F4EEC0
MDKKILNVGLVMPIAPIDGCSAGHWIDVKRIISESLSDIPNYKTEPKIVSEGNSVGLIHRRIVEGLYTSDIIICDVSCKNPNVMFELGMRLAFDKPTVIIKDDQTDYSFDTGVIEHLQYPRDLRYKEIVEFKERLAEKVVATYQDSISDPNHSPFLKSFGTFKAATLKENTVSTDQFLIDAIQDLRIDMASIKRNIKQTTNTTIVNSPRSHKSAEDLIFTGIMEFLEKKISDDQDTGVQTKLSLSVLTDFVETRFNDGNNFMSRNNIKNRIIDFLKMNKIDFVE